MGVVDENASRRISKGNFSSFFSKHTGSTAVVNQQQQQQQQHHKPGFNIFKARRHDSTSEVDKTKSPSLVIEQSFARMYSNSDMKPQEYLVRIMSELIVACSRIEVINPSLTDLLRRKMHESGLVDCLKAIEASGDLRLILESLNFQFRSTNALKAADIDITDSSGHSTTTTPTPTVADMVINEMFCTRSIE